MAIDVPAKLRRTAAALGCASGEELCLRFRSVNPGTECRPERLRAWLRGHAVPHSARFYADWAVVAGISRPGPWIAECDVGAFADELAMRHGERTTPSAARDLVGHAAQASPTPAVTLCGAFACYSHAWSPAHRGQLIRGTLRIHRGGEGEVRAVYSETLLGDTIQMVGDVETTAGTVHMLLREAVSGLPLFLALILPPPTTTALLGIMAGPCFIVDHSLPAGTRLVAIRVPDSARLDDSNRYLVMAPNEVAADLAALGLTGERAQRLDELIAAFLQAGPDQVEPQDLLPFENA